MRFGRMLTWSFAAALTLAVFGGSPAFAAPDLTRTEIINEGVGFPGVCDAPCYSVSKVSDVYFDGNPTAPGVCAAGENTFVYELTHIGGTLPAPSIPLTEFEVQADFSLVGSAGFIAGPGIAPVSTTVNPLNVVSWDFPQTCPGCLEQGLTSAQLYICATGTAGSMPNNVSTTALILDAPGECLAPIPGGPACDLEIDKTCCVPQPTVANDDICDSRILRARFKVAGGECSDGTNSQGGKAHCEGPNPIVNPAVDEISVMFHGWGSGGMTATPSSGLGVGDEFDVENTGYSGHCRSFTRMSLWGPGGDQFLRIKTSCGKPLRCGDRFGALELVELETVEGGVKTCGGGSQTGSACDAPAGGVGTQCDAKLVDAVFEFNAQDCQDPLANPQGGEARCHGDASDANTPVSIRYTGKKKAKTTVSPSSGIQNGDTFRVSATGMKSLHPNLKLKIEDDDSIEQSIKLHVSCSEPLACGDEFGSLKLVGFTTKTGLEVDCSGGGGPPVFQDSCECPVAPPTPHCTSKLEELQLVYLKDLFGSNCSVSNGQDGKASCTGDDLVGDDVTITILTTPAKISATPDMGIDEKDVFSIIKEAYGMKQALPSDLSFVATDEFGNSQTVTIHSSCSEELNLGDRFGDFAIFAMDRGDGDNAGYGGWGGDSDDSDSDSDSDSYLGTSGEDGLISLGCEIEYQYTVTNPNAGAVDNVTVDDNPHGLVVENETLAPSETKTFFLTKTLFETTTNTGLVTGDLASGGTCELADDDVTVTITLPPQGSFSCHKARPIDELTMEWGGGAPIRVRAWDGHPGSTLLADIDDIQPGDLVAVDGMGGYPHDQVWELFLPGTMTKVGESKFNLSCHDQAMNGLEDCGSNQGNGKHNYPFLINNWLLEGMSGDETMSCTPGIIPSSDDPGTGCGLGAELVFLLPGLMWLARRRRS